MKYRLQNNGWKYWTGISPDGMQYIVGPCLPDIHVLIFDPEGRLVGKRAVRLADPPRQYEGSKIYVTDGDFIASMEREIFDLLESYRITPQAIEISEFYDDEFHVGIMTMPNEYTEFLENPDGYSQDDKAMFEEGIRGWRERRWYAFTWGEEHWMSEEGEVMH